MNALMPTSVIGRPPFSFRLDGDWSKGRHHRDGTAGWAHHGIAVTTGGEVCTFDEELPLVQVLSQSGELLRTFPVNLVEGHGMHIVNEGGRDFLWISDLGRKHRLHQEDGAYPAGRSPLRGTVAKFTLDGHEVTRLAAPDLPMYVDGDFCPTQVAVDEKRFGGSGDIWVTDCYGQGVVHRYDSTGGYIATIDGEQGAGHFAHPHAVYIDRRGAAPELYVADRGNRRIQVHDLEGRYLRCFGEEFLSSPSGFAAYGYHLLISELDSDICIVGIDDKLVVQLGEVDPSEPSQPGWPDSSRTAVPVRPAPTPGRPNTSHGIAVDSHKNIYVTEWLIGGRLVKLTRQH